MLAPLAAAAAALLVVSGLAKIRTPGPAARMIATLLPARRPTSRVLRIVARGTGAVEIAAGVPAIALGGRVAPALVGLGYVVLLAVSVRLLVLGRGGARVACGCFGRDDTPVGAAHLVLNTVCLAVALGAGVAGVPVWAGLPAAADGSAVQLIVGGAQVLLLTWLAYLSITALPALAAARRAVLSPTGFR